MLVDKKIEKKKKRKLKAYVFRTKKKINFKYYMYIDSQNRLGSPRPKSNLGKG